MSSRKPVPRLAPRALSKRRPREPGEMPKPSRPAGVEAQILEAQRRGLFDDLPGHGKPLTGLGNINDPLWWVKQWIDREKLSVTPPAFALRRDVEKGLEEIAEMTREDRVLARLETLDAAIAHANRTAVHGPATSLPRLDVTKLLAAWRAGQAS